MNLFVSSEFMFLPQTDQAKKIFLETKISSMRNILIMVSSSVSSDIFSVFFYVKFRKNDKRPKQNYIFVKNFRQNYDRVICKINIQNKFFQRVCFFRSSESLKHKDLDQKIQNMAEIWENLSCIFQNIKFYS